MIMKTMEKFLYIISITICMIMSLFTIYIEMTGGYSDAIKMMLVILSVSSFFSFILYGVINLVYACIIYG